MPGKLKPRLLWLLAICSVLIAAYAACGYWLAPRLLRSQAISWVRENYRRELALGAVRVDPFRLSVEIRDIALPDVDRVSMVSAQRVFVDFEASSLWHRAWVFRSLELDKPSVRAVMRGNGTINLADLALKPDPAAPARDPDAPPPRVWIRSLAVTQGAAEYAQISRRQRPLSRRAAPITFSLRDFRTTSEGGRFALTARTSADELIEWQGTIGLSPKINSRGEFAVTNARAAGIAELLREGPPFEVSSGLLSFKGRYDFALGATLTLTAQLPQAELAGLGIRPPAEKADWIAVPSISLKEIGFDLARKSLAVGRLQVQGLSARTWLNANGSLNLSSLLVDPKSAPAAAAGANAAAAPRTPDWAFTLGEINILNAAVDFEDRRLTPRSRFSIKPIHMTVRNVGLDLSRALPVSLDATINDSALLNIAGVVTASPLAAALDVSAKKVRLRMLQPYLMPGADMTIKSGTLSTAGRLTLVTKPHKPSTIRFEGDLAVDALRTVDNARSEDLFSLKRLEVRRAKLTLAPDALQIQRVLVQEPYARLIMSPEGILNVSAVLDPQGTAQRRAEQLKQAAPPVQSRAASREKARAARAARTRKSVVAPKPVIVQPVADTFPVRIGEVRVEKGRLNFSDLNIRPNFSAEILDLAGTITAVSSARESRANVDLKGNLGEFSPVTIHGTIQPFAFDRFTDIGMKFENIALPVFNPYSGTFAGYNISKGKLTTELHYLIVDRKLNASHDVRIDQLEWGEASEFKGEASLPVKFATVLLRDRNGVIKLNIPIAGSLDDPTLRIGPIVWQIIKNVIVKAATAPFALLGSLFAGAEEAQFVSFAPGDASLDAASAERLGALAKGLATKEGISVDIPLATEPGIDRPALLQKRFGQLLDKVATEASAGKARDDSPAISYESLTASQKLDAQVAWLRLQKREAPKLPEPPVPPAGATRAESRDLADQAAVSFLEQQLQQTVALQSDDLEQLAQARAQAVQGALLRSGELPAMRVFVVREGKMQGHEGRVRLQLDLK